MWTPPAESYSWKPIESAPLDEDVSLQVTDGRGKPYTLRNPSRLTAAGWVSSGKGTPLAVTPVRCFPAPWRADAMPCGYVVRDANGQALCRDNPTEAFQGPSLPQPPALVALSG
jgi:hypothetical protein